MNSNEKYISQILARRHTHVHAEFEDASFSNIVVRSRPQTHPPNAVLSLGGRVTAPQT